MKRKISRRAVPGMAFAGFNLGGAAQFLAADEHCGDWAIGRVLIEMNASDGDIGFHTLFDGDRLGTRADDEPREETSSWMDQAFDGSAALATQGVTENFFESSEPSCEIQDLPAFLRCSLREHTLLIWMATRAAPCSPMTSRLHRQTSSSTARTSRGNTETTSASAASTDTNPLARTPLSATRWSWSRMLMTLWCSNMKFTIRVPASVNKIRVPKAYRAALPPNTPLKVEVGAIEYRGGGVNPYGNQNFHRRRRILQQSGAKRYVRRRTATSRNTGLTLLAEVESLGWWRERLAPPPRSHLVRAGVVNPTTPAARGAH